MNNRRIFKGLATVGEMMEQYGKEGTTVTIERGRITEIQQNRAVLRYNDRGCGSVILKLNRKEEKKGFGRKICLGK